MVDIILCLELGDPHADGKGDDRIIAHHRCPGDGFAQSAAHRPRAGEIGARQDHAEFFAADTPDDIVLAQGRFRPFGHFFDNRVPSRVTEAVVDALEMIDVEDCEAQPRGLFGLRCRDLPAEIAHERATVGEGGQRIGHGEDFELAPGGIFARQRLADVVRGDDRQAQQQQTDPGQQILVELVGDSASLRCTRGRRQRFALARLDRIQSAGNCLDCIAVAPASHDPHRVALTVFVGQLDHRVDDHVQMRQIDCQCAGPQQLVAIVADQRSQSFVRRSRGLATLVERLEKGRPPGQQIAATAPHLLQRCRAQVVGFEQDL